MVVKAADGEVDRGKQVGTTEAGILKYSTRSADETQALGTRLGELLQPGDVVLLQGELGAGKTCLTQGIARGLGIADQVVSPTFVLVGQYQGRERLYHADLYRLDNLAEIGDLELSTSTEDGVLVVEWPERGIECLPAEHLLVRLEHRLPDERALAFEAQGPRAVAILRRLAGT